MKAENNFKQTEIGLIPEDWEVVRLGEVAYFETGKRMKGGALKDGDVFSIGGEHITDDGRIEFQPLKFISKSFYSQMKKGKVRIGDILICKDGAKTGKTAFVRYLPFQYCSVNEHIYILRSKTNEQLLNQFLFFFIFSQYGQKQIRKIFHGLIGGINQRDLANILIPLPPLEEQRKIAKVLDKIQQAIEIQDRIIEQAKNLKKSLMQKLFTEGLYGEELKETEIGLIPKNWEVVRFENAILRKRVKVGKIKQKEYKKLGKYPVIDQSQNYISGFSNDDEKVYRGPLPVIIFGDHTRIFKYIDFPFIIGADGVKLIIPNDKLFDPKFLYFALLTLDIPSRGYNRHYPLLREKKIPLPPLEEQKQIAQILSTVDKKIEIEQKRKEVLKELFKTMLYKLMSGEIRLKEVEI